MVFKAVSSNCKIMAKSIVKKAASKAAVPKTAQKSAAKPIPVKTDSALEEFFTDELKDIYWAEKKLVKTLPKLQKASTSEQLKAAFESHLDETEVHVKRLEKAFELLGK